ncbi:MAG: LCP family protein, partial [Caldilineaceae bacterium]|nr:LCP family protein [Caldilineaceae bacterium]
VTANTSLPDLTAFDAIQVDQASEVQQVAPAETDNRTTQNVQPAAQLSDDLPQDRINILLLGTDEREDEYGPAHTDTMMLVSLDLRHNTASMISLPRDLWLPIPGYDITTKINTAYVIGERRDYPGGGPQLAKDTVSSFIGRPVDYYVRVNFNGFVRFIDLIGGVDVFVERTIHDEQYPTPDYGVELFHLDAGQHHLDGQTSLKYVRTRHGDSDYFRASRQQQVIQAVVDKVLAADMIPTLVARAPALTATMRDSFGTDVPLQVAIDLANYMRHNGLSNVQRLVLDSRYGEESYSEEGAWILIPDRNRVRTALSQIFDTPVSEVSETVSAVGAVSAITAGAADLSPQNPPLVSEAANVRLEVLNGTDYPGVAARIRDLLQSEGWQVVAIGDADRSDYRRTLLVNYNIDETLVNRINGALQLPPDLPVLNGLVVSQNVDMRIIVGQDFLKDVLDINIP